MTAFDRADPGVWARLDLRLLQNGHLHLWLSREILEEDLVELTGLGYRVVRVDCSSWLIPRDGCIALGGALGLPDHYGKNLDALWDCLTDLEIDPRGGLVLVLEGIDAPRRQPGALDTILELLTRAGPYQLLFGGRLIVALRTDDPSADVMVPQVTGAAWNPREFLRSSRRP